MHWARKKRKTNKGVLVGVIEIVVSADTIWMTRAGLDVLHWWHMYFFGPRHCEGC